MVINIGNNFCNINERNDQMPSATHFVGGLNQLDRLSLVAKTENKKIKFRASSLIPPFFV
jgi:hypothetical protein